MLPDDVNVDSEAAQSGLAVVCNGRGDNGGHCCWIAGKVCEFLIEEDGVPRCSLWSVQMRKSSKWRDAPVGLWFKKTYPGYDCKDWPQNIPEAMERGAKVGPYALCCWGRGNT